MNKSARAAAIEAAPVPPEYITVPGDAATFNGHLFTDTFANDYRQEIGWTDEHELQILQMLATAEIVDGVQVPREPITVFCQTVTEGDGLIRDYGAYATDNSTRDRFLHNLS